MADQADVDALISRLGVDGTITEELIRSLLDRYVFLDLATAEAWEVRASRYHALVNMAESGSSRNMGDMYKNAIDMAKYYRGKHNDAIHDPEEPVVKGRRTQTGRIVRA